MDDWILPAWMQELKDVSYVSVITFTCVCTGETVFALRKSSDASEAALCFFTQWYKRNGACAILWSDNAPEYISAMMAIVCKMIGVKKHIFSALGSHCRFVERKQAVLAKVMYQAEQMGQGVNDKQLELFVAHGEIETNHIIVTDGATVFERTRGTKPRTSKDILIEPQLMSDIKAMSSDDIVHELTKPVDIATAKAINERCCELLGMHRVQQAYRSRRNMCNRLKADAVKKVDWQTMNEGLIIGDLVSFRGREWRMLDSDGPGNGKFNKVLLRDPTGRDKDVWVVFNLVRPVCIERELLGLPDEDFNAFDRGDIVAYVLDSVVQLGLFIDWIADNKVMLQQFEPAKNVVTTWRLMWTDGMEFERALSCPQGFLPATIDVPKTDVICQVFLNGKHVLNEISCNLLNSKGYKA
jgi:hypothetical protein